MKVVKIILIAGVSIIVLTAAGLFIFLKTFDLNKYIPQITSEAKKSLGRDVKIGRADLAFSLTKGVLLQVTDVSVADDLKFSPNPFFVVEEVNVGLDLGVLILSQKLQLTQILIKAPKIVVRRSKDGLINVMSMAAASSNASQSPLKQGQVASAALPALLIHAVLIQNAEVIYIDEMMSPRFEMTVRKLDIEINDFSLDRPFNLMVKAAVFSLEQNMEMKTKVGMDLVASLVHVSGMVISIDLARFDLAQLSRGIPGLDALALKKLSGIVSIQVPDLKAGVKGLEGLKATIALDKGSISAANIPADLLNIDLVANLDEKQIDVKTIRFEMASGVAQGNAQVMNYLLTPVVKGVLQVDGVDVKNLLAVYKLPLQVGGTLLGSCRFEFSGKTPEEIMASINGDISADIKQGVLLNVNLLAWGLEKIPLLSGLLDSILPSLSSASQQEVKQGITSLQTCKARALLVKGVVHLETADLLTREVAAQAKGLIDMKSGMDIKADVRISKDISARLQRSVKKLASLNDDAGQIYIPVGISGPVSTPAVMPDVEYLTKKMIVAVGADALEKVLGTSQGAEAVDAIFGLFKKK